MIIVDLDNCISDDKWRIPLIHHDAANDFLKYHAYHMAIPGDPLANVEILKGYLNNQIIISTSRPITYKWLTLDWLDYHHIRYAQIYMRPKDDYTSTSVEIKRKALYLVRKQFPHHAIEMAYDDRPDVIAMYQAEGIPATHKYVHPYDWKEWYGDSKKRSGDSGRDGGNLSGTQRPVQG